MPYSKNCAGCHNVYFDPGKRTIAENNIACEACHGPGSGHAASGAVDLIVNPSRLSTERRDMICAACHVRGTDSTGEYLFPVGYLPGEDLSLFLLPNDMRGDKGETVRQAIARLYEYWRAEKQKGVLGQCLT